MSYNCSHHYIKTNILYTRLIHEKYDTKTKFSLHQFYYTVHLKWVIGTHDAILFIFGGHNIIVSYLTMSFFLIHTAQSAT